MRPDRAKTLLARIFSICAARKPPSAGQHRLQALLLLEHLIILPKQPRCPSWVNL